MRNKTIKGLALLMTLLMLAASVCVFAACGEDEIESVFRLDKTDIALTVDENVEVLTLTIVNVNEEPVWTSSNPDVATVTVGATPNKATVKGIKEGSAVISVIAGSNIQVCAVKVNAGTKLELITESIEVLVGRTDKILVETNVDRLSYASSNPSVARVDADGLVTGVSAGTASITVSGGNKTVICPVTVIGPSVVITDPANKDTIIQLTLEDGENTYQLAAESNGDIEWFIGDDSIANVDENGLVTAVKEGTTTVTARYGSAEDTRTVKVKGEIIRVALSETAYTLEANDSFALTADVTSSLGELDDDTVTWSVVSGDNLVSVSDTGVVTSLGDIYGTAVVRATSNKDADSWAECTITVPDPYADWIKISDKESLENAFKTGNEDKNMYLTGDIDLGGATINSTLGAYSGKFEGRGYEIMNFTCGRLFGGITANGVIEKLAITCTANIPAQNGLFGMEMAGTIENCRFDITFGDQSFTAVFGLFGAAGTKVSNTILLLHNPSNTSNVYAGFVQGARGVWTNVYYTVYEGSVTANGPASRTDAQLKTPATFDGWDTDVWQIEEGEIPTLINGGNIGDVKVELNKTELTIHKDDEFTLIATVKPSKLSAEDKAVTWESSDETVATVDENGKITALKEGTATITATSVKDDTKTASCAVTVNAATVITCTSETELQLEIGGKSKITATVNQGKLIYTSSNTAVATVDERGNIVAVAAGTATVTVRSDESAGKKVEITVTVMPEVQISIDGDAQFDMEIGEQKSLTLNNNRDDDNGVWTSSDTTVATVDADGNITAIKAGRVTITYTSAVDSKKTASVRVTVQPEITLDVVDSLTIKTNVETDLGAVVSRGGLTYVSSDEQVVTVTADGKVTGLMEGTATVTVTSVIDGTKTAEVEITVSDTVEVVISLDKATATLDWDGTVKLTVRVNVPGVTWASSDETVATVDQNGLVTALNKDGATTITVTSTEDETKSATCEITVSYVEPEIIVTNPTSRDVTMEIGDVLEIVYEVSKGTASIQIDGDERVLVISDNTITARSAGTVTVKVVSSERDGMYSYNIIVTVPELPTLEITNADDAAEGVKRGNTLTLTTRANRTDGTYEWESSDEKIATVDANGVVTAVGEGEVTITVTFTTASGKSATDFVQITVYDSAILEFALAARSVAVGGTWQIDGKFVGGTVRWSSSNPAIAAVENGIVTGVATGKAVITASFAGKTATMVIHVYQKAAGTIEVSTPEQFAAMGGNTYYIVNDIDMGGVTVNTLPETVKVDGLGYKVYNFKTPKLFTQFQGYMRNLEISCVLNGNGNFDGLFGTWLGGTDGTVEDCIFRVTLSGNANQCGFAHHNNRGTVKNVILYVDIENGAGGEKRPVWYENPNGTVNNLFVVKGTGSFAAVIGATEKTEAQLKQASTFDESWEKGWVIIDGELPVLKGALVTEPLKVKLDKTATELYVGETDTVTAIVTPAELDEDDRAVIWTSGDNTIATVVNGVITAKKAGTVTIRATSATESEKYAECTVTVNAITLAINNDSKVSELKLGGTQLLEYTINHGSATWSTSDASIATVADTGLVTAVGTGTVTITVTSTLDRTVSDSIVIEVKNSVVITVELSQTSLSLDRGETATLTATVTNSNDGVTWSVADGDDVVTVDGNGKVTALGKDGTAVIRATANDDGGSGEYTYVECTVTVEYVDEIINVYSAELKISVGGAKTIDEIASADKGGFTLELKENSVEGIVTVDGNKITALSSGEVTVVLTWSIEYDDIADKTYELTVTVFVPTVELSIDTDKRTVKVGETSAARTLHVTMDNMPASPAAEDIVWSSSDETVIGGITAGYSDGAYTGAMGAVGEGYATVTATYTVEGIEYKVSCDVAVFTASGSWTAVYNAGTFTNALSGSGNYYLAHDVDMGGATVSRTYSLKSVIDGRGFTVSNFTTPALFFINDSGSVLENIKIVCTLDGNAGNEGIFGHHGNGGTIRNCYLDVTFGTNTNGVSPALMNHVNNAIFENIIVVTHNPNGRSGVHADFFETGGTVSNMISYRADSSIGSAKKGKNVTLAQFTSASTYDESWEAHWVITDGEMPELMLVGFPQAHRHTFAKEWSSDGVNHWHAATCEHVDEVKDLGAHDELGLDGECSVCGYIDPTKHRHTYSDWQNDETNHWKVTTCADHDEETVLLEAHDQKGPGKSCSVCGYKPELSYELKYGAEANMPSDEWVYWQGGSTVSGTYDKGTVTVTFSGNSGDWWKTQLFYKDSAITNNPGARITMTIVSTVSGRITVNGQVINLVAGEEYSFSGNGNNGNALISIQMGVSAGNAIDIAAATITFTNITIT